MEIFSFGMLAGMIFTIIFIMCFKIIGEKEEKKPDTPDVLAAKLRALHMTCGLSDNERDIIKNAAEYIEKGIKDEEE